MMYWKQMWSKEKRSVSTRLTLSNSHYQEIYTNFFDLEVDFYHEKKILDVGCGPRGSLEWASHAAARVCLDPLSVRYGDFNAGGQHMVYVEAGIEKIPFPKDSFDVVASINNLDHVEDAESGVRELVRVLKTGGSLLLIVEIHALPTPCEPLTLGWNVTKLFKQTGLTVEMERHFETKGKFCNVSGTNSARPVFRTEDPAHSGCPHFDHRNSLSRDGFLVARMKKRPDL
ncbi:S-adenosyl-L-methionine-dependent methyltransferase [Baffinella frigidus]|nr:S-adenosyl-L-methionine-dependent methyltransferase [Cryptophyta sp. CCMP2293]